MARVRYSTRCPAIAAEICQPTVITYLSNDESGQEAHFMGNEFGQGREWRSSWELEWWQLGLEPHRGIQSMVRDLNHLYRNLPALYEQDFGQGGFSWIDCQDAERSLLSFLRRGRNGETVVVAFNFTPSHATATASEFRSIVLTWKFSTAIHTIMAAAISETLVKFMPNLYPGWATLFREIELPPLAGIMLTPA